MFTVTEISLHITEVSLTWLYMNHMYDIQ